MLVDTPKRILKEILRLLDKLQEVTRNPPKPHKIYTCPTAFGVWTLVETDHGYWGFSVDDLENIAEDYTEKDIPSRMWIIPVHKKSDILKADRVTLVEEL